MKIACAFAIGAALCTSVVTNAQMINFATIKCKEFVALPKETIDLVAVWLDGYGSDADDADTMKVDFSTAKAAGDKIKAYCAQKPEIKLIDAADRVLEK